jgi:subtilisin family serine protease
MRFSIPFRASVLVAGPLVAGLSAHVAGAQLPREPDGWDVPAVLREARTPEGMRHVEDELLLRLEDFGRDRHAVDAAIEARGARVVGELPALGLLRVRVAPGRKALQERGSLGALAGVRSAELNEVGEGGELPDDPHFPGQWHLDNSGDAGGTPGADIDAVRAWNIAQGDDGIVVAVLDSGIDYTHPELGPRALPGWDFVNEDPDPTFDHPHGVYVTGLLATVTDNASGLASADRHCRVLPVKVLNSVNGGTSFDLAQGIAWSVAQGADVISMSLINFSGTTTMVDALNYASSAGCILVACAGNLGWGNADVSWPGASPQTISIGHTDRNDKRITETASGSALDFVAPGVSVRTTTPYSHGGFTSFTGCSAATPVAAGIVSMMLGVNPDLTQDDVYELLRAGAEDQVGGTSDVRGRDDYYGHGRLNAYQSLSALCGCTSAGPLLASPQTIETVEGGRQRWSLDAGAAHAGRLYLVLGSVSGTSPGVLVDGHLLPLIPDAWMAFTLYTPNLAPLEGSFGFLDGEGRAEAAFALPPLDPGFAGALFHHAYLAIDHGGSGEAVLASNAVSVLLD